MTPKQIAQIRAKHNLTQEQFAALLGVSFATVNRWELGKSTPRGSQAAAIADLASRLDLGAPEVAADSAIGRRRRKVLPTRSMEQMLWDAACSIRGERDAPKFKDYLLPLLFLKRLSDVFDDEIARLAEEYGSIDVALEIANGDHSVVRCYIPPEARWAVISGRQHHAWPPDRTPKSLGEHLTLACRAVARANPRLLGVIDAIDFAAAPNGEREISDSALKGVIETLSAPKNRLGLADVEPDFLGRCYEYLLRKFAENSGQSAGEFFTPREVGLLMARVMRPRAGDECHDYACGSAGLLIKLQLTAKAQDPLSKTPLRLYGQEIQKESYAIAWMNTIIHDMAAEIKRGDSMRNPKFQNADGSLKQFDIVVANPMWNQVFPADVYESDSYGRFREQGGVTNGRADWAWLQHTLACMNDTGRACVVLDTGAATRGSGSQSEDKERNIRKWFVQQDVVEGVILLPENLFYNTSAAGIVIVLNKRKPEDRRNGVVMLDASKAFRKGAPKNFIPEEMIPELADAFLSGTHDGGLVRFVPVSEIEEKDFNLSPARYIHHPDTTEQVELIDAIRAYNAAWDQDRVASERLEPALATLASLFPSEQIPLEAAI